MRQCNHMVAFVRLCVRVRVRVRVSVRFSSTKHPHWVLSLAQKKPKKSWARSNGGGRSQPGLVRGSSTSKIRRIARKENTQRQKKNLAAQIP